MDKRDMEDAKMQAREGVREVLDEVHKEQDDVAVKRAIGAMWSALPQEVKEQMRKEKPDVVKQMDQMYGAVKTQGNPWGGKK